VRGPASGSGAHPLLSILSSVRKYHLFFCPKTWVTLGVSIWFFPIVFFFPQSALLTSVHDFCSPVLAPTSLGWFISAESSPPRLSGKFLTVRGPRTLAGGCLLHEESVLWAIGFFPGTLTNRAFAVLFGLNPGQPPSQSPTACFQTACNTGCTQPSSFFPRGASFGKPMTGHLPPHIGSLTPGSIPKNPSLSVDLLPFY